MEQTRRRSSKRGVGVLSFILAVVLAASAIVLYIVINRDVGVLVTNMEELEAAIQEAEPGDTIVLQNGIWEDVLIRINGQHGTEEEPITLRAETGGEVWLTGTSRLRIGRDHWIVDGLVFRDGGLDSESLGDVIEFRDGSDLAKHSRLTNTQMLYYNPPADQADTNEASDPVPYKWVSIFGQHNRVDHSHFEGKTNGESLLVVWRYREQNEADGDGDYHTIDHNYFGNVPELGANGAEAIRIGTSHYSRGDSFTTIEHNLFERYDGEAELISVKSGRNVIRYNTVLDSSSGITLRHGDYSEVYGNFILGGRKLGVGIRVVGVGHKIYNNYISGIIGTDTSWRSAITLMSGDPEHNEREAEGPLLLHTYKQIQDVEISGNTLVNNRHNVHIGAGSYTLPPTDIKFSNNLIYSEHNRLFNYIKQPTAVQYENNVAFGHVVGFSPIPDGIIQEDPQMEIGEDGLYRSQAGSLTQRVGSTLIEDGHRPLTRADVGPDWLDALIRYVGKLDHHFIEAEHFVAVEGDVVTSVCDICSDARMIQPADSEEQSVSAAYRVEVLEEGEYYLHIRSNADQSATAPIQVQLENGEQRTVPGSTRGLQWKTHEEAILLPAGVIRFTVNTEMPLDRIAVSQVQKTPR